MLKPPTKWNLQVIWLQLDSTETIPPGVNNINILRAPFCVQSQKALKDSQVISLFYFWDLCRLKLRVNKLVKLTTPAVNFINVIRTNFLYERHISGYFSALLKNSYKKRACTMLMKLTAAVRKYTTDKMWAVLLISTTEHKSYHLSLIRYQ